MASESSKQAKSSLPFERKGKGKASSNPPPKASAAASRRQGTGIPEVVSQRMLRRMLIFCGLPSLLGLITFPVSYFVFSSHLVDLPNVAVLLASLGFFGLGVLGLSYGVLSASWDEGISGSALGWQEFQLNLGRTIDSWKEARAKQR